MNALCPHCQTRVDTATDGTCPICRRTIENAGSPDAKETFTETADGSRGTAVSPELMLCPMCGASVCAWEAGCPDCGEVFYSDGLWRLGDKLLIMHKDAALPDRCIKTNQPAQGLRLKRHLAWHAPAWYLVAIVGSATCVGLILYVIISLFVRKTATIDIGLSQETFDRRRKKMINAWLISLLGIALFAGGISTLSTLAVGLTLILIGTALFLAGLIYGKAATQMVVVTKIKDDHLWLKGFHKDYLAQFSEWSGGK